MMNEILGGGVRGVGISRLVLDVLKQHKPSIPDFADSLRKVPGVERVKITLVEVNERTESIQVTIKGENLDFEAIRAKIEELGATIHSVDEVISKD